MCIVLNVRKTLVFKTQIVPTAYSRLCRLQLTEASAVSRDEEFTKKTEYRQEHTKKKDCRYAVFFYIENFMVKQHRMIFVYLHTFYIHLTKLR